MEERELLINATVRIVGSELGAKLCNSADDVDYLTKAVLSTLIDCYDSLRLKPPVGNSEVQKVPTCKPL